MVVAEISKEDKDLVARAVDICLKTVSGPVYPMVDGHAMMLAGAALNETILRLKKEFKKQ